MDSTFSSSTTATTTAISSRLAPSTWASSHSPAAIRRSAALTATLAAPCPPHCPRSTPPPQTDFSLESSYPSSLLRLLDSPSTSSFSRRLFVLYQVREAPSSFVSSRLLHSTPRLRGLYLASTSASSSWLSPRGNRMLAQTHTHAQDFFKKIQLHRSFMGVRSLVIPGAECALPQLAHLWHAYSISEARRVWSVAGLAYN